MKRIVFFVVIIATIFVSCADNKTIDGVTYRSYGIINQESCKNDSIPVDIKEPVVYIRTETGGYKGGSCWNDTEARYYENTDRPYWTFLDFLLKQLKPQITYLDFKGIEKLIHTNHETEREYYGNSTDYEIKYIILSELENYLNRLDY